MFLDNETFISSSMRSDADAELYITTTEANVLIPMVDPDNGRDFQANTLELESGSASDIFFKINEGKYIGVLSPNSIKTLSGKINSITIITSGAKLRFQGWARGYNKT